MRYRVKDERPIWIPEFGGYVKSECWDDPSMVGGYRDKPCTMNRIRVNSNMTQKFSYFWYHSGHKAWYGPVEVSGGMPSTSGPDGFYGNMACGTPPEDPEIDRGFIYDAIRNYGKSDVNIGVFLGELRETVNMFKSPLDCARAIARGKIPKWIKSLPDAIKFVSSSYLGYRYGWKPFLSDVKGFTRLSKRFDENHDASYYSTVPITLKAFRHAEVASSLKGGNEYYGGPQYLVNWDNSRTIEILVCEYCKVQSNPSAAALGIANKFASFYRLADVASIAWELTPMSFIVDWFLPIGDMIDEHLSSPANLVAASGPWTWVRRKDLIKVSNSGFKAGLWSSSIQFGYEVENTHFTRESMGAFPPKPSDLNGWQKLDLALIAGQSLGKLFGRAP